MDALKQSFLLPVPELTEENLPDQAGRVFIVTGGYAGCGLALSKILYSKNGTVYIAGRDSTKADKAVAEIKESTPASSGRVEFIKLDLADLTTIKPGISAFLNNESRLDVLTLNAGVMVPPAGLKTAQGYDLQMGTNCVGSFLVFKLLQPLLTKTSLSSPPGSVRVTWAASTAVDFCSPKSGIQFDEQGAPRSEGLDQWGFYGQSKVGNLFFAKELARRFPIAEGKSGLVTNAWNPGNLKTELGRHGSTVQNMLLNLILYPAVYGAYTELWAGWSEEAGKPGANGEYVWPWGRFGGYRADVDVSVKDGTAAKFWDWCEQEVKAYM